MSVQYLLNHPPSPSSTSTTSTTLSQPRTAAKRSSPSRGPWRLDEDRHLHHLVDHLGPRHWSLIATHLPHRSGKQARERWINQLNPQLRKKNWTAREDHIILSMHQQLGNKWSTIAQSLPGRTDNSVKNRYNSTLKRAIRDRNAAARPCSVNDVVTALHARPFLARKYPVLPPAARPASPAPMPLPMPCSPLSGSPPHSLSPPSSSCRPLPDRRSVHSIDSLVHHHHKPQFYSTTPPAAPYMYVAPCVAPTAHR